MKSIDQEIYRRGITIRLFEEKLLELFSQGKLSGTVHTCIGQELTGLAVADQLRDGDWVFSNHRCHGHYLAWKNDVPGLLAEIMGLPQGICGGRGGSQHIYRDQFLSNGVQGGGVPIAAGCAFALKNAGGQGIAVAFIGDGTLGEGVIYETFNLAKKWELPLLIVLEHNRYAQSTDTARTIAGDIRKRFESFGVDFWESSIWDGEELFATAKSAVDHVRSTRHPAALCLNCYRLKAHSKGDDNRDAKEIESYRDKDPLFDFERKNPDTSAKIFAECQAAINATTAQIEKDATPAVETYSVETPQTSNDWKALEPLPAAARVVERLRAGLRGIMTKDSKVILIGEDMEDPYGGAFKATKGLSTEFPGRVRNTPISEAAVVGIGNGLAIAGNRPIVEIMFGDFVTLAADQIINQASKFNYIYNDQVNVPIIIRTPMGGRRGYGATHSQSLEKHFFGTPGLSIAAVSSVFDPAQLLERLHQRLTGPCLLIENKLAYSLPVHTTAPDGRPWQANNAPFPTLRLGGGSEHADVTIVTYGGMIEEVEAAAKRAFIEDEIAVEIIAPTMIFPLDVEPIVQAVARSRRLIIVEEGQGFAGFGAEVVSQCAERFQEAPFRVRRVCAAPYPIPCSKDLEKSALPHADQILEAIRTIYK